LSSGDLRAIGVGSVAAVRPLIRRCEAFNPLSLPSPIANCQLPIASRQAFLAKKGLQERGSLLECSILDD